MQSQSNKKKIKQGLMVKVSPERYSQPHLSHKIVIELIWEGAIHNHILFIHL